MPTRRVKKSRNGQICRNGLSGRVLDNSVWVSISYEANFACPRLAPMDNKLQYCHIPLPVY